MPGQTLSAVTTTGLLRGNDGNAYFTLSRETPYFFVGLSGTYTGLTLQIKGSRSQSVYYDIASFTSDAVGPLIGPLAPTDGASIAYFGDCRAFGYLQVNVLSITGGSVTPEVLFGDFFFGGAAPLSVGAAVQTIVEMRKIVSILTSWIGLPSGPILSLPIEVIGQNVGGSF